MTTCIHTAGLAFRAAAKSGGNQNGPNCVEVAAFVKARASNPSGNCVEMSVARGHTAACTPATCSTPGIREGDVVVRDSKDGTSGPVVVFSPAEWADYTTQVAHGREDRDGAAYIIKDPRGTGIVLRYTAAEWDAFRDGCRRGEFTADALAAA